MRNIILITTLLFCYSCFYGQDKDTFFVDLKLEEIPTTENTYVSFIPLSDIIIDSINSIGNRYKVINFNLSHILPLPNEASLKNKNFRVENIGEGNFSLIWDSQGDQNFNNDEKINLVVNQPHIIPIFFEEKGKKFNLNLFVKVNNLDKTLHIRPLFKYKFILKSNYFEIYPNTMLTNIVKCQNGGDCSNKESYRLQEFIKLDSCWVVINNLNFIENIAQIVQIDSTKRPIGSRVGYFANMSLIKNLSKSQDSTIQVWKSNSNNYSLLHFWGPWCRPCIQEFGKIKNLESYLEKGPIDIIHFSLCFNEQDVNEVETYILNKDISSSQEIILPNSNCESHNRYIDACNPIHVLDIFNYPTYVLVSPNNEIMYRGEYSKELIQLIRKIMSK